MVKGQFINFSKLIGCCFGPITIWIITNEYVMNSWCIQLQKCINIIFVYHQYIWMIYRDSISASSDQHHRVSCEYPCTKLWHIHLFLQLVNQIGTVFPITTTLIISYEYYTILVIEELISSVSDLFSLVCLNANNFLMIIHKVLYCITEWLVIA